MKVIFLLCLLPICSIALSQSDLYGDENQIFWVDSVYNSLTLEQKIGQLFMVAAYSNKGKLHKDEIISLINNQYIGGLIFFQGTPEKQAILTNLYQEQSKVPLFIAMDAEWGLSMRISNTIEYPWASSLGAITDDDLIYKMGQDIAKQLKRLGVHINMAPVIDVNTNLNNPIIGNRAFSDSPQTVTNKALAYIKGMQDMNVIACVKHFPGHGDTHKDSHKTLPTIPHDRTRLDTIELYPFKKMISEGVRGIMTAHLYVPKIDNNRKYPSSLSKKTIEELLKKELGYKGLVFTDALNMKGVSNIYKPGALELQAFEAGNDILLYPEDVPKSIELLKYKIQRSKESYRKLEKSVKKILMAKYLSGLDKREPIEIKNIVAELNAPEYENLNKKLTHASITLLRNRGNLLPLRSFENRKIVYLGMGNGKVNNAPFLNMLRNYAPIEELNYFDIKKYKKKKNLLNKTIIIGIHGGAKKPWQKDSLTTDEKKTIFELSKAAEVILVYFTSAYQIELSNLIEKTDAIVLSHQNTLNAQEITAQVIMGSLEAKGKIPMFISEEFQPNNSVNIESIKRLKYSMPASKNINQSNLQKELDSVVLRGIDFEAYPGAQLWIALNGNVIHNRSYGYHTYKNKIRVKNNHLYDIASLTKILTSTSLLMLDIEKNNTSLDVPFSNYYSKLKNTNKSNLTLREILTHQAGLKSWIPYYLSTIGDKAELLPIYYSKIKKNKYNTQVADNLFILDSYKDTIFNKIVESALEKENQYIYSDLGFYLIKDYLEKQWNKSFPKLLKEHFFAPLGMHRITYLPKTRFQLNEIVPTEVDMNFRKQLVHGHVHDQGAAMLGGISGHAGLFSNANEVGKFMNLFLQQGKYAGKQYFKEQTIREFTVYQFDDNRRGLGFDKPPLKGKSPVCDCASFTSFGHTGFTGTIAWVDPEYNLVFVFLSNRIYPSAKNRNLITMDLRAQIMSILYKYIWK